MPNRKDKPDAGYGHGTAGEWLKGHFGRDKRKSVALGVLVAVFCVVCARALVCCYWPERAVAGPPVASKLAPMALSQAGPAEPGSPKQAPAEPARKTPKRRQITRDLFAVNIELFPPKETLSKVSLAEGRNDGQSAQAVLKTRQRVIQAQARALALQTTVISSDPTAIINGRVLRIGDWINGFKMIEITPRSCTLEKNGIRVVLQMDH